VNEEVLAHSGAVAPKKKKKSVTIYIKISSFQYINSREIYEIK